MEDHCQAIPGLARNRVPAGEFPRLSVACRPSGACVLSAHDEKDRGPPRARDGAGDRGATILDVSERLFARHGYDGVTLRTIAREAGVDVALINYYFGPKQQLFDTVFQRRARILNDDRLDALNRARAEADPRPVPLERIIEAYLRPLEMAQESEDQGWRNYCALLAFVNTSRCGARCS